MDREHEAALAKLERDRGVKVLCPICRKRDWHVRQFGPEGKEDAKPIERLDLQCEGCGLLLSFVTP